MNAMLKRVIEYECNVDEVLTSSTADGCGVEDASLGISDKSRAGRPPIRLLLPLSLMHQSTKGSERVLCSPECYKTGRNDLVQSVAVVSNSGLLGGFCGLLDQHVIKSSFIFTDKI